MGKRGPQPVGEKAIAPSDYFRPAIGPVANDEQRRAAEWFDSFDPRDRAKLLAMLKRLHDEKQIVILDIMVNG